MAAPSFKFNGSVITLAGTADLRVVSATDNDGSTKIDVTGVAQTQHEYEAGLDDPELTVDVLGADGLSRGDTGATTITWFDGGSTNIGSSVIVGKQKAGSIDDRIVHSITIVPFSSAA